MTDEDNTRPKDVWLLAAGPGPRRSRLRWYLKLVSFLGLLYNKSCILHV